MDHHKCKIEMKVCTWTESFVAIACIINYIDTGLSLVYTCRIIQDDLSWAMKTTQVV